MVGKEIESAKSALPILEFLVETYGPAGAMAIVTVVLLAFALAWFYQQWRLGREFSELKRRYDAELERVADQKRTWRIFFFEKVGGLTSEEARSLVLKNQFPDGPSARKSLEEEPQDTQRSRPGKEKRKK